MMRELLFVIETDPKGKGRPKFSARGGFVKAYTPKLTRDYEQVIAEEARRTMAGAPLLSGPLEVWLEFYMPVPVSKPKKWKALALFDKILPTTKPDLDNLTKAIYDAFNGVVWVDDNLVTDSHQKKRFSESPCVVVRVRELDAEASNK